MCLGGSPDMPAVQKPDPVVVNEDQAAGGRSAQSAGRSKIAALYGERSMRVTGGMGLPGGAQTAAKTALGA